jgi:hypothetical protein
MAVGDIWVASNEFTYQKNPDSYSFHLRIDAEAVPGNVPEDVLDFAEQRETAWLPLHNPSVVFECVSARQLFPTPGLPRNRRTDNSGNRSCDPVSSHLPGQCSAVVTLYGDVADPTASNRGRDFITGQCCNDQINGTWDSGAGSYLESLCNFYRDMTNVFTQGGNVFSIGIFSPTRAGFRTGPDVPPDPPYFWPLVFVRARSLVRTQRRRQPEDRCEEVCEAEVTAGIP